MLKNYVFALTTLACLTLLTGCEHVTNAASDQAAVPVQVRTPAVVERPESVSASGSVEGSETADVAFQVGGRVARVLVEEGQHVSKGQLLAEIEPTDYRNAFNAATAQKASGGSRRAEGRRGTPETGTGTGPHRLRALGRRIQAHEVPGGKEEPASERLSEDRGGVQRLRESAIRWRQEGTRKEDRAHRRRAGTRRGGPGQRGTKAAG